MEKFNEKVYYREQIIELVGKIEDKEVLEYLYVFIKEKARAQTK